MKLKSVKVEQFKKIAEVNIALSALNILVGANGSGKSSVLQAIHLASCSMRQARELRSNGTSTVSIGELDYLPSDNYAELGHNAQWGNQNDSPSSKVSFTFSDDAATDVVAWGQMRSARNAGISVSGNAPAQTSSLFRGQGNFFSAYIPGISGIPNTESKQSKRVVLKACSFGDSNVYLRNALLLLTSAEVTQIETWLNSLIGPVTLNVSHRDETDLTISARAVIGNKALPLELLGTGYLQLIQIFCYILLFKPKILLIDEPDIHLHPNVQEKLPPVLFNIAEEKDIKILLSTHSPFLVRGAPLSTNVYWMENGNVNGAQRETIEIALGWGAFGKRILIVSEDGNTDLLKRIISQWPELEKVVAVHPGRGYRNLLKRDEAIELYNSLGQKFHILVQRDRDSLTDNEVNDLRTNYNTTGVSLWITDESDIEAYFCTAEIISTVASCDPTVAQDYLNDTIVQHATNAKTQFISQRKAHNEELHSAGGGPTNDEVWASFQARALKGTKGKFLFNQLKNKIPQQKFSETAVQTAVFPVEIGITLKSEIERIIG